MLRIRVAPPSAERFTLSQTLPPPNVPLKQRLVSAIGWSVAVKAGFQLVTWAMTLVVIRVLSPNDYGLMAVSQVFTNFMLGFSNFGLGDALVQREETPRRLVAGVFGFLLLISLALTAGLALAAYPIARWYADPRLVPLIQVSSLGFIFNGLTTLPRMFLTKSLRVRPIFITEFTAGLVSAVTVVGLAFTGHGVWALMLGWLAGNLAKLIGLVVLTAEYYVWPTLDLATVRPLLGYGLYRTLEYTAWMVLTSADVLIIGRVLGPAELGLYTVALNFAGMPLSKVAPIINSVAFPAFAMVQGRLSDARFYALKALRLMAVLGVPVFFGISATAPEIVDIVFGPHWAAARPLLQVLALALTFRALLVVIPNYLQGIGDARAGFWCTAAGAVILPPAILVGCSWGIIGVCYAWLLCYPVVFCAAALIAARQGGLAFGAVIATPVRPMLAGAVMMLGVMAMRSVLPSAMPEFVRLCCLVAIGAAIYGVVVAAVFRDLMRELGRLAQRGGQPAALAPLGAPPA